MGSKPVEAVFVSILVLVGASIAITVAPGAALAQDDFDQSIVDEVNEEEIATVNERLDGVNERLVNVDPVPMLEEVEASNADEAEAEAERLQNDADELQDVIFTQVVKEINAQAQERAGMDIASPVSTPEEARDEAQYIEDTYVPITQDAQEGADALREAADGVEALHETVDQASAKLQGDNTGTVEGTVTDEDGDPIEGVSVEADGTIGSATTDADGAYSFETAPGEQTIVFSADGYETTEESAEVATDESTTVDATLSAAEGDDGGSALPGFGVAVALVALLSTAVAATRRSGRRD